MGTPTRRVVEAGGIYVHFLFTAVVGFLSLEIKLRIQGRLCPFVPKKKVTFKKIHKSKNATLSYTFITTILWMICMVVGDVT